MAHNIRNEQINLCKYEYICKQWKHCPGGGTPTWNRRGCSSEILNLTPKGDHLGVAQAFCDP